MGCLLTDEDVRNAEVKRSNKAMAVKYRGFEIVQQVNRMMTGTVNGFSPSASVSHMKNRLKLRERELIESLERNRNAQQFLEGFRETY